jgi:alpha,alpha-trehalose phosphorylase (configuration-retaining)
VDFAVSKGWTTDRTERHWLRDGGALKAPSDGGADIVFVEGLEMSEVIQIAKGAAPHRLVIFRSYSEVRDDLWSNVTLADVLLKTPGKDDVLPYAAEDKMIWLPPSSDW